MWWGEEGKEGQSEGTLTDNMNLEKTQTGLCGGNWSETATPQSGKRFGGRRRRRIGAVDQTHLRKISIAQKEFPIVVRRQSSFLREFLRRPWTRRFFDLPSLPFIAAHLLNRGLRHRFRSRSAAVEIYHHHMFASTRERPCYVNVYVLVGLLRCGAHLHVSVSSRVCEASTCKWLVMSDGRSQWGMGPFEAHDMSVPTGRNRQHLASLKR